MVAKIIKNGKTLWLEVNYLGPVPDPDSSFVDGNIYIRDRNNSLYVFDANNADEILLYVEGHLRGRWISRIHTNDNNVQQKKFEEEE